ncbi:MAG TPA: arsenate reductase (glutaredoxin) [Flavobacterium sp.]|uniref:arsenate reductase (glutaredoxin) n=1 Tax=Flavobacterium sp. TaxID=239 RepID=UPI002F427C31
MIQIYHNPRCGKSRNCLALIADSGKEYEIVKYLEHPPTIAQLVSLLKKLNKKPLELVRQKEKIWIDNFKDKTLTDDEIIKAMTENPILIERPIVINGDKAIIGRELDKVASFI